MTGPRVPAYKRHEDCPDAEKLHTPCPKGYLGWHDWAATKSRTHRQKKCPTCGFLAVWVPKQKEHPFDAAMRHSDGGDHA